MSVVSALLVAALGAQQDPVAHAPVPGGETVAAGSVGPGPGEWLERGAGLLDVEDPLGAWRAFLEVVAPELLVDRDLGLGRAQLMLGRSAQAVQLGEGALGAAPVRQDAMALLVRALIKARQFDDAVTRAERFVDRAPRATAELLAAKGSALFRVQRVHEAADVYQRVVALDQRNAEAHLRLGSGLLGPVVVGVPGELRRAVTALAAGRHDEAIALLLRALREQPGHPIAHRLLGETLFAQRTASSMAAHDPAYLALAAALPRPDVSALPVQRFVPGYELLGPERRAVVDRTAALFGSRLAKLVAVGGRHDLLQELERTTDADARKNLRGRRTFDGRVWDDVRGVGGLRAATGIEALDDAVTFGFDTFAHEVAHQMHYYAFTPVQKARIRALYDRAVADGRCLDYYAATNEAEYFGQGVEAFVSLGKRPGGETTHGHTRWELRRVDPDLYEFVAGLVDFDPLLDDAARVPLLEAAIGVALRCGRPHDAEVAAELLPSGALRDRLRAQAVEVAAWMKSH
ncbi:MAG: tetratricopeptide repeat protein [Planctomycetes bacterium]|nr:tetratricopeptide repeat protein [Planctomycetota bacterium]